MQGKTRAIADVAGGGSRAYAPMRHGGAPETQSLSRPARGPAHAPHRHTHIHRSRDKHPTMQPAHPRDTTAVTNPIRWAQHGSAELCLTHGFTHGSRAAAAAVSRPHLQSPRPGAPRAPP